MPDRDPAAMMAAIFGHNPPEPTPPEKRERNFYDEFRAMLGDDPVLWWNFDQALAGFMAAGLSMMSERGHSHPVEIPEDDWDKALNEHAESLRHYATNISGAVEDIEDALLFVCEHFRSLWD